MGVEIKRQWNLIGHPLSKQSKYWTRIYRARDQKEDQESDRMMREDVDLERHGQRPRSCAEIERKKFVPCNNRRNIGSGFILN